MVPLRALSFCAIARPHVVPSHELTLTPTAIVASGAMLVNWIWTAPVVVIVNGFVEEPCWPNVPENESVVVETVADADGVVGVVELQPAAESITLARQATIVTATDMVRHMEMSAKQEGCHRSEKCCRVRFA